MARIVVCAEGTVDAPADTVYRYVADVTGQVHLSGAIAGLSRLAGDAGIGRTG